MEEAIQKIILELKKSQYDINAWIFPPEHLVNPSSRYKKFYVGTFVVVKHA